MKHIWQIVVLALLGCAISISFVLLMSHVVVRILEHEEARELEVEKEIYQMQREKSFSESSDSYFQSDVVLSRLPQGNYNAYLVAFDLHEQEMNIKQEQSGEMQMGGM